MSEAKDVLRTIVASFPEMADPDAELNGGDAVERLCELWPMIKAAAEEKSDEADLQAEAPESSLTLDALHDCALVLDSINRSISGKSVAVREVTRKAHTALAQAEGRVINVGLLEALETLTGHVAHYAPMPHAHSDAYHDLANAYAAIARAEGRAQS